MRTLGPAVAEFFSANLHHTKGAFFGRPFFLEPWQFEDINLIFEIDENGRRRWRSILWGIPRGNGKSPCAAGIGLFELLDREDAPEIFCAAAAKEQAAIVQEFAHTMPKGGPLDDYLIYPRRQSSPLKVAYNGGIMRTVSADGGLQHGKSISAAVIDELHVFTTNKQEELYFALATASHKREDSIELIITTAGPTKASLLGEMYDAALKTYELEISEDGCRTVGRHEESQSLLIWRAAPDNADVSDPGIWRKCNPASWIPDTELSRMACKVPESVFRRLILNQWVLGVDAAIQPASWDACLNVKLAAIEAQTDIWAAVDVGERRDTSAVTVVAPRESGELIVQSKIFNPEKEHVKTLLPMIEAEVRRLASNYVLHGCAFDPWQFRRSAELLSADGIRMIEVPQTERHMVPASQLVFDLIEQKRIIHDGDVGLRRHVLSAEAKQTSRGTWRFVKPLQAHGRRVDESQKVDALIALAMACAAWSYDVTGEGHIWAAQW